MGLRFQVTDVKKPLLAVRRLVEKGNVVRFGPEPGESYIANIETGKKIELTAVSREARWRAKAVSNADSRIAAGKQGPPSHSFSVQKSKQASFRKRRHRTH